VIKSKKTGSAELVVSTGEKRNPFLTVVWKPEGGTFAWKS
jgi:hypothetical protein